MTLPWSTIDRRWPGASVLWDRDVAGEGWEPVFVERDGVLWARNMSCYAGNGSYFCRRVDCRCRQWFDSRWLNYEDRVQWAQGETERRRWRRSVALLDRQSRDDD